MPSKPVCTPRTRRGTSCPPEAGSWHSTSRVWALGETVILGVTTNIPFLRRLLVHPAVAAGELDTGLVERILPEVTSGAAVPTGVLAAAALLFHAGPPSAAGSLPATGSRVFTPD